MSERIPVILDDKLAKYVTTQAYIEHKSPPELVASLVRQWYEARLQNLHHSYLKGDITLRGVARELGLSYRELYELLEEKDLAF